MKLLRIVNAKLILTLSLWIFTCWKVSAQDSCGSPEDLTEIVPQDGSAYQFIVDVNNGNQYYQYTAPQDGDFKFSTCGGGANTYVVVYDENCLIVDEADQVPGCYGGAEYIMSMSAGETFIFSWDDRNMVPGFKIFTSSAYFQPYLGGDLPENAISMAEGTNQVTRFLQISILHS